MVGAAWPAHRRRQLGRPMPLPVKPHARQSGLRGGQRHGADGALKAGVDDGGIKSHDGWPFEMFVGVFSSRESQRSCVWEIAFLTI